ncbi:MAG: hypothetical protein HY675_01640 [Chloroflexi bacterium]|nr:hypothetical protein [Chloroflexota bacterium]
MVCSRDGSRVRLGRSLHAGGAADAYRGPQAHDSSGAREAGRRRNTGAGGKDRALYNKMSVLQYNANGELQVDDIRYQQDWYADHG